jgi:hypothetical protein
MQGWQGRPLSIATVRLRGVVEMLVTEMLLYMDDPLSERSRLYAERVITGMEGVLFARFNEQHTRLVRITYDRHCTSSLQILKDMLGKKLMVDRIA